MYVAGDAAIASEANNPVRGHWSRFQSLPNEHPAKTLTIALALCLVCSVLVTTAAVLLKPRHQMNEEILAKQREILRAVGRYQEGENVSAAFKQVDQRVVDLTTGEYVVDINAATFSYDKAVQDPELRMEIAAQDDIAKVRAISKYAPVYLIRDDGKTTYIVVPVHGYGLWSTMRAYLAIEADGNRIAGVSFYQHGETPGLGGEITNVRWQRDWQGKRLFDTQGNIRFRLVKGADDVEASQQPFSVDALSGATITSNGVTNLIHFWLGDLGYGPYFKRHFHQGD